MKIRDLFVADVTRDIPPVVYFHQQNPETVQAEVGEYIITGGYPSSDPRSRRVKLGIHEHFVQLLQGIVRELAKVGGPELPASWISGFYGSGKSSFAKLLGLALDGLVLPDGTPLATALLRRDDSPRSQEFAEAWEALAAKVEPLSVVFDIGGVARDDEQIHSAVLRCLQVRLGYCSKDNRVAEYELRLERDGEWPAFVEAARTTLGKDWHLAKEEEQADDHFSHVLHVLKPDRYPDPTSWIDSRAGSRTGAGTSASEAVESIAAMIDLRAPGKTLFLVVDEVSQYIHQDESRMLKLQSFVSELGHRLRGRVWLFATGQQKLDDNTENNHLAKLKDRFPLHLRVHLAPTDIRDVVHKRLLKKRPDHDRGLRELFERHRGDLKLHGYACEEITEEDFVEVYPMLPGQIDLLMRITSNLRSRSSRTQSDSHAIRGLLQLLGELFREQKLADREVGSLVTLDSIFEVQQSALDADTQNTFTRILGDPQIQNDELALRAAKAVALLELIQDEGTPTTPELVAQCLYARLGEGNRIQAVTEALEMLRSHNLLSFTEKQGFKIQSSAGQEWQRERDNFPVAQEVTSRIVQDTIKNRVGSLQERPRMKGHPFPWTLWYSDGRQSNDVKLQDTREDSTFAVDFRYLARKEDRTSDSWVARSAVEPLNNRLVWVIGEPDSIEEAARQLARSESMLQRYRPRLASLTREKQRLVFEEETRSEELANRVREEIEQSLLHGKVYFRGHELSPREVASAFGPALLHFAQRFLPNLYPHFTEIAITPTELQQLLAKELAGPSVKFMDGGLGILSLDGGKYVASCTGSYPTRIAQVIEQANGLSGQSLLSTFVSPPYGCAPDLVKASCAGLLRAKKIRIRTERGDEITSYVDPGVSDVFLKDRDFRRAELFPAAEGEVTPRDRVAIRNLFKTYFQSDVEPENELIADQTFALFPARRDQLREAERRFERLPGRPPLAPALERLGRALEECCRSRQVQKTVVAIKRHLDPLRDGLEQLGVIQSDLTPEAIEGLQSAVRIRDHELAQLRQGEEISGFEDDAALLESHLAADRPWRDLGALTPAIDRLRRRYVEVRGTLLNHQSMAVEEAKNRIKVRPDFARLDVDTTHHILRPLADLIVVTSPEAVAPTLGELRDPFPSRLHRAEELANDRLDEELSRRLEGAVRKFETHLRGREIASRQQLTDLLRELEERLGPLVDQGIRVRLT